MDCADKKRIRKPCRYIIRTTHGIYLLTFRPIAVRCLAPLTHWGRDIMAALAQTALSYAFLWMEICEFWLKGKYTINIQKAEVGRAMMTSSNGNIFRVTSPLCGEFTGHEGQGRGALMFSLICTWTKGWVKQSKRRWFDTPSRSLWRYCNSMNDYKICIPHNIGSWPRYILRRFCHFDDTVHICNALVWSYLQRI